jgi:HEAT repeat protein
MDDQTAGPGVAAGDGGGEGDGRSDLKVVLQFFIVPLALVAVLVSVFFGLQFLRARRPDPGATLRGLEKYEGFLGEWVGDLKRWQSGYDLSLLLRSGAAADFDRVLPSLVDSFRQAGTAGDLKLRRYLALVLANSGHPGAAPALREGLADADGPVRLFCAWGLANGGETSALADLRRLAADPDPGIRKVALFGLGQLKDAGAAPLLIAALGDAGEDVRWNAALALARLGRNEGAAVLRDLLETSAFAVNGNGAAADPEARAARAPQAINAIRGLALIRDEAAVELLQRARDGAADPAVREAARLALEAAPAAAGGEAALDSPGGDF